MIMTFRSPVPADVSVRSAGPARARPRSLVMQSSPAPVRIGIIGGMGPMAGVYLQQLIIEATPAKRDQDHLQVVCFTNPQVPDRTRSLEEDGGRRYVQAIRDSASLLVDAGATLIVIPCNTAHARLDDIRCGIPVPFVNMIELTAQEAAAQYTPGTSIAVLVTVGTRREEVYQRALEPRGFPCLLPNDEEQGRLMDVIHAIKAGRTNDVAEALVGITSALVARGAGVVLLGCTELSLCHAAVAALGTPVLDPLRIVARHVATFSQR
jgi:aspartate racemase